MNKKNNQILGNLEAEIMEIVWKYRKVSVRDVLNKMTRKNKPAYTTIMTVMVRLNEKGILKRKLNSHDAYVYTAVQNKDNFLASFSKKIISSLFNECGEDIAVAQFVDFLDSSNIKKSKELRKKLMEIVN